MQVIVKKLTLRELREVTYFDVPQIADDNQLYAVSLIHMLHSIPVDKRIAAAILERISTRRHIDCSLENIEVACIPESIEAEKADQRTDKPPTFKMVRQAHCLTLAQIIQQSGVSTRQVILIDKDGIGTASAICRLLKALSDLTGTFYDLTAVGGFWFVSDPLRFDVPKIYEGIKL